jgi:acetoacetyl-CoA synthetase
MERASGTQIAAFAKKAEAKSGHKLPDYAALHAWSIKDPATFWEMIWDECGIIGEKGEEALLYPEAMPGAQFFPQARLNYAENLLRKRDDTLAIVSVSEDKRELRWSWHELHEYVASIANALRSMGVKPGDRVAAMVPNTAETVALMLGTAAIGAVWSSCSPDFGERGVLDRFSQIDPKVFITCDGYWYGGKTVHSSEKLPAILAGLPTVERVVLINHIGNAEIIADKTPQAVTLDEWIKTHKTGTLHFEPMPFNAPLFILFSSGTTGIPKCIVHGAGGTLIQHLKEHQLQCDIRSGDRFFYFTTCGWMMWNWLVSGLATQATLILFDGSPFSPTPSVLFDLAERESITLFGTSAKYIDACRKEGMMPNTTHNLSTIRAITSTGSPLAPEAFQYVYDAIKSDVHLASISGGTDIVSCFVGGNPISPVYKGEIQCAGLGMAVDVYSDDAQSIREEKGELVCTKPFPSMPIMFWNDEGGKKYKAAYFERFENIWCHGDFAEITAHGGIIIHGRSDATLNPGGVRIGTAEIYAQVEAIPEVMEALAIGQDWQDDVRVVLFVRLKTGLELDDALTDRLKKQIRNGASPRHVPAKIISVLDIPRTKSGKIVELAVREVVHGRPVKNIEALANPEALELFKNLEALRS